MYNKLSCHVTFDEFEHVKSIFLKNIILLKYNSHFIFTTLNILRCWWFLLNNVQKPLYDLNINAGGIIIQGYHRVYKQL